MKKTNIAGWLVIAAGALVVAGALVLSPGGDGCGLIGHICSSVRK